MLLILDLLSLFCIPEISLVTILPRERSYGLISTITLSPVTIFIKFFLIFPDIVHKTVEELIQEAEVKEVKKASTRKKATKKEEVADAE